MREKIQPIRISRVVERWEVAVSRQALEHAGWRCESCQSDSGLRVFADRGARLVVLCPSCRIAAGWAPIVSEERASRWERRAEQKRRTETG